MKRLLSALLCAVFLLLPACREEPPEPRPDQLVEAAAWTAPDGANVDLWDSVILGLVYRLEDGTELLRLREPWPWYANSFGGLEPTVQENIAAYYEDRGLLFDVDERIALAYADWLDTQATGREFYSHIAEQSVSCWYETDRHVGFVTTVTLPKEDFFDRVIVDERTCLLFDRATGELADPWVLFSVPPEDALDYILGLYLEPPSRKVLKENFAPERILWAQDHITVEYPAGALASEGIETASLRAFDYEDWKDILHPWAIPEEANT